MNHWCHDDDRKSLQNVCFCGLGLVDCLAQWQGRTGAKGYDTILLSYDPDYIEALPRGAPVRARRTAGPVRPCSVAHRNRRATLSLKNVEKSNNV